MLGSVSSANFNLSRCFRDRYTTIVSNLVSHTVRLYQEAARSTVHSFTRGWITIIAVIIFSGLMVLATMVSAPLGLAGGFLLGAVNALLIGATLSLIEQSVKGVRTLGIQDVLESFGQYFWDVIGVGFVLWVPLLLLDASMNANPYGGFFTAAVLLFLFILLNPAPEVIYLTRQDSPLGVMRASYEFVVENWIEWFLPFALILAPLGLSFFFSLSDRLGRGAGLDFFQVAIVPFTLLTAWLSYLGFPEEVSTVLVLMMTPPLAAAMLFFRGHLFGALSGSTRRQRLFQGQSERPDS